MKDLPHGPEWEADQAKQAAEESEMNEEQAYCACLKVDYCPEKVSGGKLRERWWCRDCNTEFVKRQELTDLKAEMSDKTLRWGCTCEGSKTSPCNGCEFNAVTKELQEEIGELKEGRKAVREIFGENAQSLIDSEKQIEELKKELRDVTDQLFIAKQAEAQREEMKKTPAVTRKEGHSRLTKDDFDFSEEANMI